MNETERALFSVAIAAAGLMIGYHFGLKRAAAQAAKPGTPGAAPAGDHMDWFMTYGGGWAQ